jgi:prepilin-type N-terminal cleavage/methylation domain-containing protein
MIWQKKFAVRSEARAKRAHHGPGAPVSPISHSALCTPKSLRAFTLVELLITMVILAILAAMTLGAASSAMESARRSRTKSLIKKIDTLLMERYDSYATRRFDVRAEITGQPYNSSYTHSIEYLARNGQMRPSDRGQFLADARLLGLRELMKYEMPDRWSDIANQAYPFPNAQNDPDILATIPALARTYYRRLLLAQTSAPSPEAFLANQGAECLYITIMFGTGDGEARSLFSAQDIGDTDNDGAPEFLDGWGKPINYIRWPAGFAPRLDDPTSGLSSMMTGDGEADHDPLDVARRDSPLASRAANVLNYLDPVFKNDLQLVISRNQRVVNGETRFAAFRLMPLIYSAGPDGEYGWITGRGQQPGDEQPTRDPYQVDENDQQYGEPEVGSKTGRDNIHNQLLEY